MLSSIFIGSLLIKLTPDSAGSHPNRGAHTALIDCFTDPLKLGFVVNSFLEWRESINDQVDVFVPSKGPNPGKVVGGEITEQLENSHCAKPIELRVRLETSNALLKGRKYDHYRGCDGGTKG